jgi:hypothetical protein
VVPALRSCAGRYSANVRIPALLNAASVLGFAVLRLRVARFVSHTSDGDGKFIGEPSRSRFVLTSSGMTLDIVLRSLLAPRSQRSGPSGSFEERLSVLLDTPIVTFLYYCGFA